MSYHHGYDEVDAPSARKPRNKNLFQKELDAKMKDLRLQGQAADVTTSDGSEDQYDTYARKKKSVSPAPRQPLGSAKLRPARPSDRTPNLGDTIRPRDADSMFRRHANRDDQLDKEVASYDVKGMPMLGRTSLTGKKTPTNDKYEMTKEEKIFGRKTPTLDQGRQGGLPDSVGKKWSPPTFQKTTPMEPEPSRRTPSPASRGRQTPSSLLDPISEGSPRTPRDPYSNSATPRGDANARPRLVRQSGTGSDKSPRPLSFETSPRGTDHSEPKPRTRGARGHETDAMKSRKTPPIGRKTPPLGRKTPPPVVDVFGSHRRVDPDEDAEVESTMKSRFRNKEADGDHKTGRFGGRKTPELERRTPTGKTVPGRRTPDGLGGKKFSTGRGPTGQKTTTGRKTPVEKEEAEKKPEKRSVMDFLEDDSVAKPQAKPQAKERRKSRSDQSREEIEETTSSYRRSSRTPPLRKKSAERGYEDERGDSRGYESILDGRGYGDGKDHRGYQDGYDDRRGYGDFADGKNYDHGKGSYGEQMNGRRYDSGADRFDSRRYETDKSDLGADRMDARRYDSGANRVDGMRQHDAGRERRGYDDSIGRAQEDPRMEGRVRRRDDSLDRSSLCEELEQEPGSRKKPKADGERSPAHERDKTKHQTSTTKALESAISEVAMVQDQRAPEGTQNKDKKLSKRSDSAKHKAKPRYPTMPGETTPKRDVNYEDANSIREAVYQQWYEEHMEKSKKENARKKKEEKEVEEKKKKEKEDKIIEEKQCYNEWIKQKKVISVKENMRKKREKVLKDEEAKELEKSKERHSEGCYKSWKEKADKLFLEKTRQQKHEDERKKIDEEDKKYLKTKTSESLLRGWNVKKDRILEKKAKDEKLKKARLIRDERELKITQDEMAVQKYQDWMKNKEKSDRIYRQKSMMFEDDARPPWSPANTTVPFGH